MKKNTIKILISSFIIIIPIFIGLILWNRLPNDMVTHIGADGVADGLSSKLFAVVFLPLIMLVLHFICLFFTFKDPKNRMQSKKALNKTYWIIPMISLTVSGVMYSIALNDNTDLVAIIMPLLIGVLFVVLGNYLPKVTQNKTMGIKIPWTLKNEENWNRTHRFGGKVWIVCGFVCILTVFLPLMAKIIVFLVDILLAAVLPIMYSYSIYRQHRKAGIEYINAPALTKGEAVFAKVGAIIGIAILIVVGFIMFTGNVKVSVGDETFVIDVDYLSNREISFDAISSIEYRDECDVGTRMNGFVSAKLSLGKFKNDEFGTYTRYSYTGCKAAVILRCGDETIVISGINADETKAIYDELSAKTAG